jgi:PAP2 superfamily protein
MRTRPKSARPWMRRPSGIAASALALAVCGLAGPAHAGRDDWKDVANIGEVGLVALALGKSSVDEDWSGAKQLAYSLAVTEGLTQGLKATVHETRPDRSDDRSFPSGHTSVSFAAAGYLHQRYGWRWGAPATLAATLVGVSRVQSKDHHWYDVVAGAVIGEASAFLLTKPHDGNVVVLPWADTRGGGVMVSARF